MLGSKIKKGSQLLMFKYQILVEYVGTNFRGWQIQKRKNYSRTYSRKNFKPFKRKITLLGSGRTDTGVHAIEQSAHFECKNEIKQSNKFLKSINYF